MRRTSIVLRSVAIVLGIALLVAMLRVWLPSVIFVYGRAGSTPATDMGIFAAIPFLLGFVGVLAVRVVPARYVAAAAGTVLVVARLAVQATAGGDPQLWAATVGIAAGIWWLVAVAGGAVAGRTAALGVVAGLAVDATLHAVLRSTDLVWRDGPVVWVVLIAVSIAFLAGSWRWAPPAPERGTPWTGAARGWFVVGPALVLHTIVAGVVSRLHVVTDWPEPAAVAVVVGGHGLAVLLAWWCLRTGRWRHAAYGGSAAVVGGLVGALGAGTVAALGYLLLPVGLAAVIAGLVAAPGTAGDARRGLACAGGMVIFLALAFGYYAAYDLVLPVGNEVLLIVAAVLVGLGALAAPREPLEVRSMPAMLLATAGAGVAAAVLLAAGAVALAADPADPATGDGLPVRVMTYNLQMGFDIDGHHAVGRQAEVIADDGATIVGLQEVSRGWLINSATDVLPQLAEQLGMVYAFTPAADDVWGNAVLSRYPLEVVEEVVLPQGDAPMRRSVQAVVIDLGGGDELGVVNTHLTHTGEDADLRAEQIVVVEAVARRLAEGGRPVVVLGDLNAEPGSAELARLEAWLTHAYDEPPAGTWASWDPVVVIDHIMVTEDLATRDYRVGDSQASDHLPVSATLDR